MKDTQVKEFIKEIQESVNVDDFVKLTFSCHQGIEKDLDRIIIRRIFIKDKLHFSFTFRYHTKDIVKNKLPEQFFQELSELINDFNTAVLSTISFDFQLQKVKGKTLLKKHKANQQRKISLDHNIEKRRTLKTKDKSYFQDLGITNQQGEVFKSAQHKFRQINHYIELLKPLLQHLPKNKQLNIVDMGSGKGYLTFALYDYLKEIKTPVNIKGIEFREDLVALCNKIAEKNNFNELRFSQGTIAAFDDENIDILIALHACDTATDDAISKGIKSNADLIVVAPCCHKQIRKEMEQEKKANELSVLTKYGIFMERQAEMVTDAIRSLILNYFGYKTKVMDFISDEHTPKNVMILAEKGHVSTQQQKIILEKIQDLKAYFGIKHHYLEQVSIFKLPSNQL